MRWTVRPVRTVETQTEVYDCDVTLTSVVEKTPSPSSVAVMENTGHVEPEDRYRARSR